MTELITTKEAASILKCSPCTVHRYVQNGKLHPDQKVEGKYFFEREKILSFTRPVQIMGNSRNRPNFNPRSSYGLEKSDLKGIIDKWQVNSQDTSSADVEIGIYTEKIKHLEVKLRQISTEDPNFKHMRYKLLWHVGERRKLLHYLQISDYGRYRKAIALLKKEGRVA